MVPWEEESGGADFTYKGEKKCVQEKEEAQGKEGTRSCEGSRCQSRVRDRNNEREVGTPLPSSETSR